MDLRDRNILLGITGGVAAYKACELARRLQDEGAQVQAVLATRIDRLPPEQKDLLQTLAVIGKEFPFRLVREVSGKSDDELQRLLSELQIAEFIYEQPAVSEVGYVFKHALSQQVAAGSALLERRRVMTYAAPRVRERSDPGEHRQQSDPGERRPSASEREPSSAHRSARGERRDRFICMNAPKMPVSRDTDLAMTPLSSRRVPL